MNALALLLTSFWTTSVLAQTCVSPPSGIIAWWPFDETSGTIATDIVGEKPAAHFGSPTPAPGRVGGSLRFDGSTDFAAAGDSNLWAFGTGNFTVEFWVNFDAPGTGDIVHAGDIFIGSDDGPGNRNKWFFALGGGLLHFTVYNTASPPPNFYLVRAPFSPVVGQWYHLAVTKLGTLFTIYVNGIAIGSEISNSPIANASAPLTIGQAESLGFMSGRLDEMTMYNRALTQAELQSIATADTAGKCKPGAGTPQSVFPSSGGDTGSVTVRISGGGFLEGTTVKLARAGFPEIIGSPVSVINGGATLLATFDLRGRSLGQWDVVIAPPGASAFRLSNGFSIEEGRAASVWVDVVGRGAIRVGQVQRFHLLFGNRGNIDGAISAWIDVVARNARLTTYFPGVVNPAIWPNFEEGLGPVYERSDISTIPITIDRVPPGFVGALPFDILVPAAGEIDIRLEVTAQ